MAGTVLVTGASGALGRPLLRELAGRGWRRRALVHRRAVDEADEHVAGDLRDIGSLRAAATGVDAVVHLAGLTHARDPRAYREVNVAGTEALLDACRREGVGRFVLVSTRAVSPEGGAYSRSKLGAEEAVRASGLPFVVVRLPEIYGAGGAEGVDRIVARVGKGRAVPVVGAGSDEVCPVLLDDVLPAVALCLDPSAAPAGRTYTLAGPCLSTRAFAEACARAHGARSRVVGLPVAIVRALSQLARVVPLPLYPDQLDRLRAGKPPASPEAASELGFRPRAVENGLAALIAQRAPLACPPS